MLKKIVIGFLLLVFANCSYADINQTIQINTHFDKINGKPTWLLIIRDMQSGQVLPYVFDIRNNDNFWVAFSSERSYKITVSNLKFNDCIAINNFCHLQDGVISGKSMFITLSGKLTRNRNSVTCHIMKYAGEPFTVVHSDE